MVKFYAKQGKVAAIAVIVSILLTSSTPTFAVESKRVGIIGTAAMACMLLFTSMSGPTLQAQEARNAVLGNQPVAQKVEPAINGKQLAEVRKEMDGGVTPAKLEEMKKAIDAEMHRTPVAKNTSASAMDSHAKTFIENVLKNPKYQYIGLTLVAGELLIGGMLWSRMRLNISTFKRRLTTAGASDLAMKPHLDRYTKAEEALVLALRKLDGEDRAELLKQVATFPEATKKVWEDLLKPIDATQPPPAPGPTVDEAWTELEAAYAAVQTAGVVEARVMTTAGPREVKAPQTLAEIAALTNGILRNVKGLSTTKDQIEAFKNEIKHLDLQARSDLGMDLKLHQKLWRKSRTALLLIALPVIALAINQAYDNSAAEQRRVEDLNTASLQDRTNALQGLIPWMHRPLLAAVVTVWKDEPRLRPYACPLKQGPVGTDNPDLQIMQALVYQTFIETYGDQMPIANPESPFDEKFFEKLFPKIFALNSALAGAEQKWLNDLNKDLSYKAVRIFDEYRAKPTQPGPTAPRDGAKPFGFSANK